MRKLDRMNPLTSIAAAAMGMAIGLLVQFYLSGRGHAPFVPPLSLPVTLVFIAAVLLGFGIRLRHNVSKRTRAVNPFHAVRLLATARAGQIVGGLLGGFGGGLVLSLLGRSVPAPVASWLPMLLVFGGGLTLVICAMITERLCRVPPGDDKGEETDPETGPEPADQAAFRKP
ncbi:DUF3180 domain-containing protein [Leucobacter viscericola]|uniref:DUF3180 domain-containing protein n=1 Tax=Leucobacter viscericola TaxID=2714935 RepID=A0A6G7XEN9_9MICO|nr:DUF3180 domain-containing protein [Leucobacter viscericola]QIK62838.1 DUF3180 domain-containing protein [Leucobacter viscericola]